jgi:hypothetical protein
MKLVLRDIQAVTKALSTLNAKIEKLQADVQKLGAAPTPAKKKAKVTKAKKVTKKATAKPKTKTAKKQTAFEQVIGIVRRSKKGVSVTQLKKKTGFDDKKIANLVYKGKKQGRIRSQGRGVYVKA